MALFTTSLLTKMSSPSKKRKTVDKSKGGDLFAHSFLANALKDSEYFHVLSDTNVVLSSNKDLRIRPLHVTDCKKGFIKLLSQLTKAPEVEENTFKQRFEELKSREDYYIVVIETSQDIVGCATVFIERKFLRDCGVAAHIEDVVVDSSMRGQGLGKILLMALKCIGGERNCYKVMLDCAEKNIGFYEKCGFTRKEIQMVHYY